MGTAQAIGKPKSNASCAPKSQVRAMTVTKTMFSKTGAAAAAAKRPVAFKTPDKRAAKEIRKT